MVRPQFVKPSPVSHVINATDVFLKVEQLRRPVNNRVIGAGPKRRAGGVPIDLQSALT